MQLKSILIKFIENLSWLFLTKRCPYCNKIIGKNESLCEDCKENLPVIKGERCKYCGCEKARCDCKKHKMGYDGITAPFYYENGAKKSIYALKFHNKIYIADTLARNMASSVKSEFPDVNFDFVTFVPFTISQRLERSYNQSELLAEKLSKNLDIPLKNTLEKLFETKSQHSLGSHFRQGNVFGAYDVRENADVKGKTILLVDDVRTSGATLSECAWILKIRGAEKVYCVTATVVATKKTDERQDKV